ncbi:YhcH/YjgK/YiaL family protein [Vibrio scophthalmi]|uniref:Protein YiaL n=1 Tax=Vibrio scophthalmi TaxID=45658 RepID=A0A1C7FGU2_9VIBR|nr:YhcH/YjgK/YiaL family protein [Vibrio scophthalmi]ANU38988.1 hypothetical protein VSVS05_03952 [Vibrio scophthalmi]
MFIGHIDHLPNQQFLSAALLHKMQLAFDAIAATPELGEKVLIENELSYNIVQGKRTSPLNKAAEIHHQYIDVHLTLDGEEHIGYATQSLEITDESQSNCDLYFGPLEEEHYVRLGMGEFAVFFPHEIHKPLCNYRDDIALVTKAIIKIRYDKL